MILLHFNSQPLKVLSSVSQRKEKKKTWPFCSHTPNYAQGQVRALVVYKFYIT